MLSSDTAPLLSLIIPAYNEAKRLPQTLERVYSFFQAQPYQAEIIVVDDGSEDETGALVSDFSRDHANVLLISLPHHGKGFAVKHGMLAGKGQYLFICDADLSMPIEEVNKFLPPALHAYDIAIGSREVVGSKRYEEPGYRHLMGRVFNFVVQLLTVRGIQDTQCGFKCLRRDVAQDLFTSQTIEGWGFDVEILFLANKRGYTIEEVPIDWYYMSSSRINPLRDSWRMLREVLKVRRNDRRGLYDCPQPDVIATSAGHGSHTTSTARDVSAK